jgi:hypothetical protein
VNAPHLKGERGKIRRAVHDGSDLSDAPKWHKVFNAGTELGEVIKFFMTKPAPPEYIDLRLESDSSVGIDKNGGVTVMGFTIFTPNGFQKLIDARAEFLKEWADYNNSNK